MARAKRTPLERERDLAITEQLHLRGRTSVEIASQLSITTGSQISPQQVKYDIRLLTRQYRSAGVRDYNVDLNQQLRRIDMLEREAWGLLDQSGGERVIKSRKTRRKSGGDGDESSVSEVGDRTEERVADARYMVVIQWCIAERNKLLGLYPPEELKHTGNVGTIREIIYELPPQKQVAPNGLTIIGGRAPELSDGAVPEPVVEHLDEDELLEIWGAPEEALNGVQ
jgi:hypothetical protein